MKLRFGPLYEVTVVLILLAAAAPLPAQEANAPPGATAEEDAAVDPQPVAGADLTEVNELVLGGTYDEAAEKLAALQEQFPDDPRVLMMRGEVLLALGRGDEALPVLERCAEVDSERTRLQFQLATALGAAGRRKDAIEAFGREIELNDDPQVKVMAHLNRSVLLEQEKDWSGAAVELEAVLALEPTRVEVYGDIATLYLRAGRLEDAASRLESGRGAGFVSAGHLYSLGARYLKEKTYEPAATAFRAAIEIDPGYAEAQRSLAVALDQLGKETEAVQHFRRYLELSPDAPDSGKVAERIRQADGG